MAADNAFRQFPQFEKLFEPAATEPFLRRVERNRKLLNEIAAKAAGKGEKERATAVLDAYTRALALVREIADLRVKMAEEAATSAPASR